MVLIFSERLAPKLLREVYKFARYQDREPSGRYSGMNVEETVTGNVRLRALS